MSRRWLSPVGGAVGFLAVAALVVGGLGWVTVEALQVESDERAATARADLLNRERLALWQLDGRLFPALGVETNRPYAHYFALSLQPAVFELDGERFDNGVARVPSPLLSADLPEWMTLHFQLDPDTGWESPQVPPAGVADKLRGAADDPAVVRNDTPERRVELDRLKALFPVRELHATLVALEAADAADGPPAVPVYPGGLGNLAEANVLNDAERGGKSLRETEAVAPTPADAGNTQQLQGYPQLAQNQKFAAGPPTRGGERAAGNNYEARKKAIEEGTKGAPQAPAAELEVLKPTAKKEARAEPTEPAKPDRAKDAGAVPPAPPAGPPAATPPTPPAPAGSPAPAPAGAGGFGGSRGAAGRPADQPARREKADEAAKGQEAKAAIPEKGKQEFGRAADHKADPRPPRELAEKLEKQVDSLNRRRGVTPLRPPAVHLGPVRPHWLTAADGTRVLALVRAARLETKVVFQGVLLDWPRLRAVLTDEVRDTFPAARLEPVGAAADGSERRMAAIPAILDPGPPSPPPPVGWSPLRIGLSLAWAAALLALAAVGVGGAALLGLSERRIRFVSAVTHELRTPLTSLRLYLDLLTSGMVTDEGKRREYLDTLSAESDRLNRLIENVLDFARLEKRTVRAHRQPTPVAEIIEQVRQTWADRTAADGKELVVVSTLPPELTVPTDPRMAGQILGNLIDNARKYARGSADPRIWLWAKPGDGRRVVFEVEDRGPGVPAADRCSIFRPFRRGRDADTAAGGAGLGLALAAQWADMLGGSLTCRPAAGGVGACFRLELPVR